MASYTGAVVADATWRVTRISLQAGTNRTGWWGEKHHVKAGKDSFTPSNFGLAVRANDWPWLYWLNTMVTDLVTGEYYAQFAPIYKKWFGEDPTYPRTGSPL